MASCAGELGRQGYVSSHGRPPCESQHYDATHCEAQAKVLHYLHAEVFLAFLVSLRY
jgi:hypothetical protein